ncbi:MAG: hypothetical protein CO030_02175 [Candidatus Magasanikbacteria bacterium CG_4_9_14_0_2_um_filter_42_11]|uniref:Uncharacterized protein n=1 Tax=Candidatus Magasanikbacteria bacterium CG_4_9_14_0_2_um_filter_42_11 TaxID=1974643 RepID=A0A2M8FA72_9BACT|nr:MAG: hypothetical protein COU34_04140 [Candidatus Magasanikbacteria bacterium CG10_big_fil_rev_8_21_14_0_10_43_9]PJC52569.1 MAG: hypothetical protein CO030_02175 [Candidatus Magasanikbacteria bacterium CG_4_9_14_0_2_um_filter_42_11]
MMQRIAIALLFFLFWSCFGFSIGMIGHEFIASAETVAVHEGMDMSHECCGIQDQTAGETQDGVQISHHGMVAILTGSITIFSFFTAFVSSILLVTILFLWNSGERTALYMRRWGERWAYFALFFSRLFSSGILHSKTW